MIYFISDLHLSEEQPEITAQFLQFMREKAPLADELYILGDLFDFWVGDDEESPLIDSVKQAITSVADSGVRCYFIHGNRDFLIGKRFAREAKMTILPDYEVIDLYGEKTLICHGDTLCTDDVKYQKFRQKVHQKWLQCLFLTLPLWIRLKIANKIRNKSQCDKQNKTIEIMDVNLPFTEKMLSKFSATQIIHGHTHRQAVHIGKKFTRIVLGDWNVGKNSILQIKEKSLLFV